MDFSSDFVSVGGYAARTDRHMVGGTVKENGVPVARRVVVLLRKEHVIVGSTFSSVGTGEWQVSNINEYPVEGLFVIVFDDSGTFNAEIADFVSQTTVP